MTNVGNSPICPYCSNAITADLTLCPSCSTPYHFACATNSGGCIIPSCSAFVGDGATSPSSNSTSFPATPVVNSNRQKVLLGVLGVAILLLGLTIGALGAKSNLFSFATGKLQTSSGVAAAKEDARIAGYEQGKKDGTEEGFAAGRTAGYTAGVNDGKNNGYSEGYNAGVTTGRESGLSEGRHAGCRAVFTALDTTRVIAYFTGTRTLEYYPSYLLSQC